MSNEKLTKIMDLTEFMKLCERLVNLELNFSNTFSNAKMTYITIVDLDELIKLGIHDVSS